jgi:hypothetical protein
MLVATKTVASRDTVRRHSVNTPEVGCITAMEPPTRSWLRWMVAITSSSEVSVSLSTPARSASVVSGWLGPRISSMKRPIRSASRGAAATTMPCGSMTRTRRPIAVASGGKAFSSWPCSISEGSAKDTGREERASSLVTAVAISERRSLALVSMLSRV